MMGFNTGATQVTEADKRIAQLEEEKRQLQQQNSQLVQQNSQREGLLRGELAQEKDAKYEQQSGFDWSFLQAPPKERNKQPANIPAEKLPEVIENLVAQSINKIATNQSQALQRDREIQQELMGKFTKEHPDLAGDPRVMDQMAKDWRAAQELAGPNFNAHEVYKRVVSRGQELKQLLPKLDPRFNNPYANTTPGSSSQTAHQIMGVDPQQKQTLLEQQHEANKQRRDDLRKKMLGIPPA